jgi:hypothetical protein
VSINTTREADPRWDLSAYRSRLAKLCPVGATGTIPSNSRPLGNVELYPPTSETIRDR